jgi:hypothetical protein
MLPWQKWWWLARQRRQFVHVIVEGLELSVPRILQNLIKPAFLAFASEE